MLGGLLGGLVDGGVEDERGLGHDDGTARHDEAGLVAAGRVDRLDQDGDGGFGTFVAARPGRPARAGTCPMP